MIIGLGIDVCAVDRVEASLERHGERFALKLLTEAEWDYCRDKPDTAALVAGRFAAKEAFIKALGGAPEGMRWSDMNVLRARPGPPRFEFTRVALSTMRALDASALLSITHDGGVAAAVVVLETRA